MFIVVCRAQHVASVARELQCWSDCFNVFSMQSPLRNAAVLVSLLSFSLEHGSLASPVVNGTLKLCFNQKTIPIAKIDELKNKKKTIQRIFSTCRQRITDSISHFWIIRVCGVYSSDAEKKIDSRINIWQLVNLKSREN